MKEGMNMKKIMDVVFLLDRSGSMHGIENDTIGGYNSYLEKLKNDNIKVTTILFDDEYEFLTKREDIKSVKPLNNKTYYVRGSTALFDAIGKSILYLEQNNPHKVLFVITTDGMENSSKEFTKNKIKEMIKRHDDWEFMYIGADIDSYNEGESLGIKKKNIANYQKTSKGVSNLFESITCAAKCMYEEDTICDNWKKDLE